jgi:hypothetical protein
MLQDLERGRPMEIDPLVSVVQEMGRLTRYWRWLHSAQKSRGCME